MRPTGPNRYTGALSDAVGPVDDRRDRRPAAIRYEMKGGLKVDQRLQLRADGTLANHVVRQEIRPRPSPPWMARSASWTDRAALLSLPPGRDMATVAQPQQQKPWGMARVIIASSAGTAFEWYDFFIFGSLAPVISKVFFAGLDPTPALLAALALFAAGFAFRPLGALIFGVVGDRLGRKGAFLITVSLMGAATFLIGLLPTYAQAGTLGPRCSSSFASCRASRSAANMAARRSTSPSMRPTSRRGASTGWIQSSASFGLLAALLVIIATRTSVGEDAFAAWGWRVPFLVPRCCSRSRCGCAPSSRRARSSPSCARMAM